MNLKKIGKILLLAMVGVVCLFIGCVLLLILALPTPYQIKKSLTGKSPMAPHASGDRTDKKSTNLVIDSNRSNSISAEVQELGPSSKVVASNLAFESLLDDRKPLSTACSNMQNIELKQIGKLDSDEFGKRFQKSLLEKSSDPLMESLKPILKFTLGQPSGRALITKAQEAQFPADGSSLMDKADFYYAAYAAYQEMVSNKENMEHVLDQSYLTMMLGRAIEAHPNLGRDPRVLEYCEEIERQLNDGARVDFLEEKKTFSDFLAQMNIDPQSIGFDPGYQTQLKFVFNKTGLRFNGGWIDEIFAQSQPKPAQNK